jgi:peptide deformylase
MEKTPEREKAMTPQEKIIRASHLIDMNDIIREGNPTLRATAAEVDQPLSDADIILGEKMLQFLKNSQDPVIAEKMGLRGGVGLAAPQLDISKRIIAALVPNPEDEEGNPPKEAYALEVIMYNPKIVAHSVQNAALADGEGCLSVDRPVEGYVPRHARVTVEYTDKNGDKQKIKLRGFNSIVVQHEIDHLNGIFFYDRINEKNPFDKPEDLVLID